MQYYYIEQTDTFGGDANYSYVRRSIVKGETVRGAVSRYARISGMNWHNVGCGRYDSTSGATCIFIDDANEYNSSNNYKFSTDDRVKA